MRELDLRRRLYGSATGIDISPAHVSGVLKDYAYEDGFTPGYVASFKKEYPNVQLQTAGVPTPAREALTKLRTGVPSRRTSSTPASTRTRPRRCGWGCTSPLDISKIPNWKYIDPALKKLPGRG